MKTMVVNLFGAPGAGKSTGAAYIFSRLKMNGINAELVTEFAKDKLWEDSKAAFKNQTYMFGEQSFRISKCIGKVDVIVTDSPLLLSIIYYDNTVGLKESFSNYAIDTFNTFHNRNYFLNRVKEYNPSGRFENEEESNEVSEKILMLLDETNIKYTCVNGDKEGYELIVNEIIDYCLRSNCVEEKEMSINEIKQDLFTVPQGYYLAHCISGDYALGAGIAKKFDEVYNMRFKLHKNYPIPDGEKFANVGKALFIDNVFNLVTKDRCYHKPTYDTLRRTLEDMKEQCIALDIDRIAMPKIGSGLDKLDWNVVRDIINDVFGNSDIDVLICCL